MEDNLIIINNISSKRGIFYIKVGMWECKMNILKASRIESCCKISKNGILFV